MYMLTPCASTFGGETAVLGCMSVKHRLSDLALMNPGNTSSSTKLLLDGVRLDTPVGMTAQRLQLQRLPTSSSSTANDAATLLQHRLDELQMLSKHP